MLENLRLTDETKEREKIERIIAEYLGNHLGELFDKNLESKLPYLRDKLLNMEGYISLEEHEESLAEAKAEQNEKILAMQKENETLRDKCRHFEAERDDLYKQIKFVKYEHDEIYAQRRHLERELQIRKDEFCKIHNEAEKKIAELEHSHARDLGMLQDRLKEREEVAHMYREKAAYYKNNYAALDEAYQKYLVLDENMRRQLAGVFGNGETVQGFFCGAVQEAHLKSLWDFICHGINNHLWTAEVEENLKSLFDFAFDAFNAGSRESTFLRIESRIGAPFDSGAMMRTSDSGQLGKVQKVLLPGYKNRVGTVVSKSLVVIGE